MNFVKHYLFKACLRLIVQGNPYDRTFSEVGTKSENLEGSKQEVQVKFHTDGSKRITSIK